MVADTHTCSMQNELIGNKAQSTKLAMKLMMTHVHDKSAKYISVGKLNNIKITITDNRELSKCFNIN